MNEECAYMPGEPLQADIPSPYKTAMTICWDNSEKFYLPRTVGLFPYVPESHPPPPENAISSERKSLSTYFICFTTANKYQISYLLKH